MAIFNPKSKKKTEQKNEESVVIETVDQKDEAPQDPVTNDAPLNSEQSTTTSTPNEDTATQQQSGDDTFAASSTEQSEAPKSNDKQKTSRFFQKKDKATASPKTSAPKKKPTTSSSGSRVKRPLTASERERARQIINLSRNKSEKDVLDQRPMPSRKHTVFSILLCLGLIFIAYLAFLTPIFTSGNIVLKPAQVMESLSMNDLELGKVISGMIVSYYVCKYFYLIYVIVLGVALFFTMLIMLVRSSYMHKQTNAVMYGVLTTLLIATLIGFNYINIVNTISPDMQISTSQFVFFILGMLIMLTKFAVDAIFGKELVENELKTSSVSILTSFTQSFLTLASLAFPLYIFPGLYRMRGIDILLGKEDVLAFLPMSGIYKTMLMAFTIITGICMAFNMAFYLSNKRLFLHFNRFSHLFSTFSMIIYALMGLNYFICYIDAKVYNTVFTMSMNTYSYVPICLLILFWLGCGFSNLALARVNVQYRIYAEPNEDENKDKEDADKKEDNKEEQPLPQGASSAQAQSPEESKKEDDSVPDPIPAFSELDKKAPQFDSKYQAKLTHTFTDITLPKLVHHVIEYAKYSRERLSYGPVEVKTFLAGIAASRLSILQGMSGTGKTSLPKIFMESIDGTCEIVAVESSWRDKNELLGYYNEFNKKYTPKTFTQCLYKACLNKEVPTFIVLDEMNLSRIEYYFSDFLSLMESREHLRFIKLFDVQLFPKIDERKEYSSLRDGHTIDIPTNVWFIGTANRDESTFEISDKVYDRAQTMNFDKRASKVNVTEDVDYPQKFVSYSTLRRLFDATKSLKFDAESYEAIKKVELLLKPYKISFGNRVLKQIEDFVKAYVACSEIGSEADREKFTHEAVDCIIFSKVVRKLELKQITDIDTLIEGFTAARLPKCLEFIYSLAEAT